MRKGEKRLYLKETTLKSFKYKSIKMRNDFNTNQIIKSPGPLYAS